jgi:exodeoxyribonuclease VII large subunit
MRRVLTNRIEHGRLRLQSIESRSVFQRPMTLIDERRQRCDELGESGGRAIRLTLERRQQQLASAAAALDALSPLRVLARGYSLTLRENGQLATSVDQLSAGQILETRLNYGTVISVIRETNLPETR